MKNAKAINTKEMAKALKEHECALNSYNYEAKLVREQSRFGSEAKKAKASAACEAAWKEFVSASAPLTSAIEEAEGRAYVRNITAKQVIEALDHIETKLNIAKKYMEGVSVEVDLNAQGFAKSYNAALRRPQSTQFYATYKSGSWRIVWVERCLCKPASCEYRIILTDEAKAAIISRIEKGIFC